MDFRFIIYGLIDPNSGQVRYVGQSSSGLQRPRYSFCNSHLKQKRHVNDWMKLLKSQGQRPVIEVLETLASRDVLNEAEQKWIAHFRALGTPLTNHTDGGDGCRGRRWSDQQKLAHSRRMSGARHPMYGKKHALESIALMSHSHSEISEETRRKLSESHRGACHSAVTLAKMSEMRRGRPQPKKRKPIVDINGVIHESVSAAAKHWGISISMVSGIARGRYPATERLGFGFVKNE